MSIEEFVAKKLKSGTYRLVDNEVGTSAMWSIYAMVAEANGSVLDGFIYCRQCKALVKYSRKTRRNAYRHKCYADLKNTNKLFIDDDDDTQDNSLINESDPISATESNVHNIEKEPMEEWCTSGNPTHVTRDKKYQKHVHMQIKKGIYELKDKAGCRSIVWSFYKMIIKDNGLPIEGLVWCTHCEQLLVHSKNTTNLARHKCFLKDQHQDEQPLAKRARYDEEEDDVRSKGSNEEMIFLSESEDTFTEEKLASIVKEPPQVDEEEEYVTSESEFFSVVKIENEKITEEDTTWEEGHSLNNTDETKNCSKYTEFEKNVATGVYSLMQKPNAKSLIWSNYDLIVKEDGTVAVGYVSCRGCKRLLKFDGKSTSNLNRHKCYLQGAKAAEKKKVHEAHKNDAIKVYSMWLLQDCLPYNTVEGKGFRKMLNFFIKIGSLYGENIDIDDLLPDSTTVAEYMRKIAEERKTTIKAQIEKLCNDVSVTVDLWPDYYLRRHFLSATLHFHTNFELNNIYLGIKSTDLKTNGKDVRNKLVKLLTEFGVSDMEKIVFVTDTQSAVKDALLDSSRLTCSNYLFSKVIDTAFERTGELNGIIGDCKSIVQYCMKNHIQMPKRPTWKIQCVSNFIRIKSISDNWQQVQHILERLTPQLAMTNFEILNDMVQLCQKFEVIFKKLQASRLPSLCYVIPSINCIKALCERKENDGQVISVFKSNILKCLEEMWLPNITLWHKAAFFLYPPANKEQPNDLVEIKDFCIEHIMEMEHNVPWCEKATNSNSELSSTTTSSKSVDSDKNTFNEDISFFFPTLVKKSLQTASKSPTEEVTRYSIDYVMIDENFNAIQWWQHNSANYPRLSKLAIRILSIPASNTTTQRDLSHAGNIVSEKINKLSPKTVNTILFLNSIQEKL